MSGNRTNVIERYNTLAPQYERRWANYLEESIRQALVVIDGPPTMRLLDVPCGTGQLMARLAAMFPRAHFIGVDGSSGMLAQARTKTIPALELIQGAAETLPLSDGQFDWVVSTSSLHHFRYVESVLHEFRRVVKPNGRLLILDWCRESWHSRLINRWLQLTDSTHAWAYTREELRRLLDDAGFVPQRMERFCVSWFRGWRIWDMMMVTASPCRQPPRHPT